MTPIKFKNKLLKIVTPKSELQQLLNLILKQIKYQIKYNENHKDEQINEIEIHLNLKKINENQSVYDHLDNNHKELIDFLINANVNFKLFKRNNATILLFNLNNLFH